MLKVSIFSTIEDRKTTAINVVIITIFVYHMSEILVNQFLNYTINLKLSKLKSYQGIISI